MSKIECSGRCNCLHGGRLYRVNVSDICGTDWGEYWYCDVAIEKDRAHDFNVTVLGEYIVRQTQKLPREITLHFNVTGTCCQTIEIDDKCELTDDEIVEGLEMGGLYTTVQEGGDLFEITGFNGLVKIGKVVGSDTECEYEDFEDVSP